MGFFFQEHQGINMLTWSGFKQALVAVIMSPVVLKILSEATEVA